MATTLKKALVDELRVLMKHDMPTLLARRAERLEGYGRFERLAEEVPEPEAPAAAPEAQPDAKADPCDCSVRQEGRTGREVREGQACRRRSEGR